MQSYVIGIDAGGTKVAYGLFDMQGNILNRYQHPTNIEADGPTFSAEIIDSIHLVLSNNKICIDDIKGIGICMPSFILFDEGYVFMTSAMPNIKNFALRDYISNKLGVVVVLDNDSNVAALAEHRHGAGKGSKHMVYVATSTGIGSGIIINENVFRGSYGWAGECGHMIATPDEGIMCGCENQGCFMSYASGRYAAKYVKQRLDAGVQSVLASSDKINGEQILSAYMADDELAVETVNRMAKYLAVCLFNIYQLLNINLFVFGGGLTNFGQVLFGKVRVEFDNYNHIKKPVEFKFAQLKKDFGIVGAAELIYDCK